MGWDGMGWGGMGWDGMGWDQIGLDWVGWYGGAVRRGTEHLQRVDRLILDLLHSERVDGVLLSSQVGRDLNDEDMFEG